MNIINEKHSLVSIFHRFVPKVLFISIEGFAVTDYRSTKVASTYSKGRPLVGNMLKEYTRLLMSPLEVILLFNLYHNVLGK